MKHKHDHRPEVRQQVSLLVPFKEDGHSRTEVWEWLKEYWENELPDVEIVMGSDTSRHRVFSKTIAVNNAASKAHGDIFVILDADAYLPGSVITDCANRIRDSISRGYPLWFIPYRRIYRLTPQATHLVRESEPENPYRFSTPPPLEDVEGTEGSAHGHHYGAMIQIMPRVAFETVGGMDCRFRGWGGEDVAFLRALDTLYGKHKSTANDVLHLWHSVHNQHWEGYWLVKEWANQKGARVNDALAMKYDRATGDRNKMRLLVNQGRSECERQHRPWYWPFSSWQHSSNEE